MTVVYVVLVLPSSLSFPPQLSHQLFSFSICSTCIPPCLSSPLLSSHSADGQTLTAPRSRASQPPPLTRRQPCCCCDTHRAVSNRFSELQRCETFAFLRQTAPSLDHKLSQCVREKRPAGLDENSGPLRSSEVGCFFDRGERGRQAKLLI